jgi:RHS repeat-associated protein
MPLPSRRARRPHPSRRRPSQTHDLRLTHEALEPRTVFAVEAYQVSVLSGMTRYETNGTAFETQPFQAPTAPAYVRHRDYSATLGRFIELDPIGFEAGDNNWYRFVANGPTGKTDPSGLRPWPVARNTWPQLPNVRSEMFRLFDKIITEAERRRGHGPWEQSAQHCWAACFFGARYGVGNFAAWLEDAWEYWDRSDDWRRDIQANHVGAAAGNAFNWKYIVGCHAENPETFCDKACKTWP